MPKKPSAKQIAADLDRLYRHQLESACGRFMGCEGAEAVRQIAAMFGQEPELVEYNGKPVVRD